VIVGVGSCACPDDALIIVSAMLCYGYHCRYGSSGICCPYNPKSKVSGVALCTAENTDINGKIVKNAYAGLDTMRVIWEANMNFP